MAACSQRLGSICRLILSTHPKHQFGQFGSISLVRRNCSGISSFIYVNHTNIEKARWSYHQQLSPGVSTLQGLQYRHLFTSLPNHSYDQEKIDKKEQSQAEDNKDSPKPEKEEKLSVFQRFKKTYKEHGKVLIVVHLMTSAVWFGSFFYAAKVGVDVIPLMEKMGFSEKIISPFRNSSVGDIALAYLMYKLATPARYTVTLAGTNFAIRYLRKVGKMQPKSEHTSLRALARDSRKELHERRHVMKRKTSVLESKMQKQMRAKLQERQAYVKATFTKFRSKLREKEKKNGHKHHVKR